VSRFNPRFAADEPPHEYHIVDCDTQGSFVDEVAAFVRELYGPVDDLAGLLREASADLGPVAPDDELQQVVSRVLQATIPEPGTGPEEAPHLDVARNELAEVLAYLALTEIFGTVIPAPRVKYKEVGGLPSRGLDVLGLDEQPEMTLVISEVKASSEDAEPPGVVEYGQTTLRGQLRARLDDPDGLIAELSWVLRHCNSEHKTQLARALLQQTRGRLPIRIVPFLLRPQDMAAETDFGAFRTAPASFDPATIRFLVVGVPESIEETATAGYGAARGAA
jgi:hypothetical protein